MRRENLFLGIGCIFAILGSYLLSNQLEVQQQKISPPRDMVSDLPLGGFQKFAADIYWMLFLQYAGANPITQKNVGEFEYRINRIVDMDPNFLRIYTEGALMLAPVSQEKALKLLDRGMQNEFTKEHWRLPMLAGQLIMRRQWDQYYQREMVSDMDMTEVRRAEFYYRQAMNTPGRQGTAINSYIRVRALLKDNGKTREYNELLSWHEYFLENRGSGADGMGSGEGMSRLRGRSYSSGSGQSPFIDSHEYGSQFDMASKIISVMRKARAKTPNDPDLDKLVAEVRDDMFPGIRFNEVTLEPIRGDSIAAFEGFLDDVEPQPYTLTLQTPQEITLLGVTGRSNQGEVMVTIEIDGRPAEGFTDLVFDSIKSQQGTACLAVAPPGSTIDLTITGADPDTDLAYQVVFYFSQSR